jgi:hypothetical protein
MRVKYKQKEPHCSGSEVTREARHKLDHGDPRIPMTLWCESRGETANEE